jgi:hypothetical protein
MKEHIAKDGLWTHLPPRPWRYHGFTIETYQACHGAPIQPGYACDHCSTGIKETHWFTGANGKRFGVGSTCVGKMLREMRTKSLAAAERAIKKERNRKSRERAAAKRRADRQKAEAMLVETRGAAEQIPHPAEWAAEQGLTLADWAEWMLTHGGGPASKKVVARLEALR